VTRPVEHLPSALPVGLAWLALSVAWALPAAAQSPPASRPVALEVYLDAYVRPVERLAYGVNEGGIPACTLRRHGGNRFTGFNWETGASNAGSDWQQQSDYYLAPQPGDRLPGGLLGRRIGDDRQLGARSLVTLQVAGYVAADAAGPVSEAETAPSARWQRVSLEATLAPARPDWQPDLGDGVVHLDEQVRDLVRRFGKAADGGVLGYALDNEPALWSVTHPRLHPQKVTWDEVTGRGVMAARQITAVDDTAQIFGPVLYGWAAFQDLQGAEDAGRYGRQDRTFVGHYLRRMAEASKTAGRRLLHRLDVHWYPEASGEQRIISEAVDAATAAARVQAPRSLWDPGYLEKSWIVDVLGEPIRLLPRLAAEIDATYPGTGLAVTEYNYGAAGHVSGGLAQADVLGIFGRQGVAACYWSLGGEQSYVEAAFRLYLAPGSELRGFGDLSVQGATSDDARVALHAARCSDDPDEVTLVVLNRDLQEPLDIELALHGDARPVVAVRGVRFDAASPELRPLARQPTPVGSTFRDRLPAAAATLYVVRLAPSGGK